MDIFSIFTLFGGVGLFLYGMNLMGSSLKNLAGGGLENILRKLTTGKSKASGMAKGFVLGTGVTAIIQSSAATTIMLIGFVNAGIMGLSQAIPVVFGANVGSTATAQILRLGDLGGTSFILKFLKPSSFAPILIGIGAFMYLFCKKKKKREVAGILVGLGVLFFGMTTMEGVFEPLKESEKFQELFVSFSNPFVGIIIGLALTALIQSSSASVGILQALSTTGAVTYASAIPVIVGINIGKCMTILLGGIGANKKAKRVSLSYLLFNLIGTVIFMVAVYGSNLLIHYGFWGDVVNRGNIANVHLAFNLAIALILLPFTSQIAKLTGTVIKDDEETKTDKIISSLDSMLLSTPSTALAQARNVMFSMMNAIIDNFYVSTDLLFEYDEKKMEQVSETEHFIDQCETKLNEYLLKVTSRQLTKEDRRLASELLNSVSDFERIGDHCEIIGKLARQKKEENVVFSEKGNSEVRVMLNAVEKIIDISFTAFKEDDPSAGVRVNILNEMIDNLKEIVKEHHVNRLQTAECSISGGFILVDLLTSLERIGAHCTNISNHTMKKLTGEGVYDEMHAHYSRAEKKTEDYKALYLYYEQMYLKPVEKYNAKAVLSDVSTEKEEAVGKSVNEAGNTEKTDMEEKQLTEAKTEEKKPAEAKQEEKKEVIEPAAASETEKMILSADISEKTKKIKTGSEEAKKKNKKNKNKK